MTFVDIRLGEERRPNRMQFLVLGQLLASFLQFEQVFNKMGG